MRVIFILIFFSLFLWSQTINEQLHALDKATPKERVALMNSIKEQLVRMNTERRMKTIETLQDKLQHKNAHQENAHQEELPEHNNIEIDDKNEAHSDIKESHDVAKEMMHKDESVHMHNELHQHQHNRREEGVLDRETPSSHVNNRNGEER